MIQIKIRSHSFLRAALVCVAALWATGLPAQKRLVAGTVVDAETDDPIAGVVVVVGATTAMSDERGAFSVSVASGDTLRFSLLGYKSREYPVNEKLGASLRVALELDVADLDEVVVEAGIIRRERAGFTGAFTSVSREELKDVGNINVIQSLKSLDPSFVVLENNLSGSNPNAMANIEMRGQTRMNISSVQNETASNNPLFILDGFEVSIEEVNDLDVNRVESITLLKDAGSTAIYGAKGANGVVVIETVKPKRGQLFVTYNGDFQIAAPDLSVYNMMNAAEKLEFELRAGRYKSTPSSDITIPEYHPGVSAQPQQLYFERLAKVQSGVDTYWLSEPVRTAFTQSHSVNVSGGEKELNYIVGLNYRHLPGVMKDSERDSYGGNVRLAYRGFEGLNIQNNLSVTGTAANDGAWGSFSDFVNANPYYTKRNPDGSIPKYLDKYDVTVAVNPLYNASLNSRIEGRTMTVTNNTALDWKVNKNLQLKGNLGLRHSTTNTINFKDPSHSSFDNSTYDRKGTYSSSHLKNTAYNANLTASYFRSFAGHNFTLIARGSLEETVNVSESFVAVGFPEGAVGYPSQAFSYRPDSRPEYSDVVRRSVGALAVFNYNYDYRYLFDFNYNVEGATNFGRNKRFENFWSVGAGWNLHREPFARNWRWISELKLRGTYGFNGNQTGQYTTHSIYSYYVGNDMFGQSAYLSQAGNPNLQWQVVEKLAAGVDLAFLDGNLKLNFDVYRNIADPQIVSLDQRPSTGVSSYPLNMGFLRSEGYEFRVSWNVINRAADKLLVKLHFTGAANRGVYGGFSESLADLNDAYRKEAGWQYSLSSLNHFRDGSSPNDFWAMRSLGIDPATGREIFLTGDGRQTYEYNPADRVVVANTRPDLEGVFGLTFRYLRLTFNANVRYSVGGYKYNSALFNKVENIRKNNIVYNQDKRALYGRWKNPGDIAEFRDIALLENENGTPVSSRFIQRDNYLRGESFKLTWNFTGDRWLDAVRLKDCSLSLSMSDFFNLYSVKLERGIDYPFQRTVAINLSARF
jgi:TonB-linked SusC/RagA family outer membrane protein